MEKMESALTTLSMVQNVDGIPAVVSWFSVFQDYMRMREAALGAEETHNTAEEFGFAVKSFLGIFPMFSDDIVFENGRVVASRFMFFVDKGANKKMSVGASAMNQLWDFVDAQTDFEPAPEPNGFMFPYWYSADNIVMETALTLIWSLVGVAIVCAVLLPDIFATLLMVFIVAVVSIDLTGFLWMMGLDLNCISLCVLAMSIGLVVDYNAHIVLAYYNVDGSASRHDTSTITGKGVDASDETSKRVEVKEASGVVVDESSGAVVSVDAAAGASKDDATPVGASTADAAVVTPVETSKEEAAVPGASDSTAMSVNERMQMAMEEMAPNISMGATTTLLGVLVLGFAKAFIFRLFFQIFVAIVAFGVLHGLVLVPVTITLFDELRAKVTRSQTEVTRWRA